MLRTCSVYTLFTVFCIFPVFCAYSPVQLIPVPIPVHRTFFSACSPLLFLFHNFIQVLCPIISQVRAISQSLLCSTLAVSMLKSEVLINQPYYQYFSIFHLTVCKCIPKFHCPIIFPIRAISHFSLIPRWQIQLNLNLRVLISQISKI